MDQEVAHRLGPRDIAAQHPDRLGERSHLEVDAPIEAEVADRAPPVLAQDAAGVRVVDHNQRLEPLGPLDDRRQRRDVAVHAEDAVGDDQLDPLVAVLLEMALEVVHVAMLDGGVVQLVADDDVALAHQRLEDSQVGGEARLEDERRLRVLELGEPTLEVLVDRHRAGDGADRARAGAPFFGRLDHGRLQPGVGRQSEVVVGREVEHVLPVHDHLGVLGRAQHPQWTEQPLLPELVELLHQELGFLLGDHLILLSRRWAAARLSPIDRFSSGPSPPGSRRAGSGG